jgi:hypothetical protein
VDPADAGAAYVRTPDGCRDLQHVIRALMWEEADPEDQLQAADSDAEQQEPAADMYFLPNFQQVQCVQMSTYVTFLCCGLAPRRAAAVENNLIPGCMYLPTTCTSCLPPCAEG